MKKGRNLNYLELIRIFLITYISTLVYIQIYIYGQFFAYISLILLVSLWTLVFYYISLNISKTNSNQVVGQNYRKYSVGLSLATKRETDFYKKIVFSSIGGLFCLFGVMIVNMIIDKEWAIGVFGVLFGTWMLWNYENLIKKKQ